MILMLDRFGVDLHLYSLHAQVKSRQPVWRQIPAFKGYLTEVQGNYVPARPGFF
jgi:hypothetical protein